MAARTAAEAERLEIAEAGAIGPAAPEAGGERWRVRAIRAGMSANDVFYPEAVLRAALPLFDGARVLVRSDEDHVAGSATDVRNLVGRLVAPRWAAAGDGAGAVEADLELLEPEGPVARLLRAAHERGMTGLMGLSIVARGRARLEDARDGPGGARPARVVEALHEVRSVDLVVEPAAGGALIDLVEAIGAAGRAGSPTGGKFRDNRKGEDMRERMRSYVAARLGAARLDGVAEGPDGDEALEALYREAAALPAPGEDPQPQADAAPGRVAALAAARLEARGALAESGLPAAARERLAGRFADAAPEDLSPSRVAGAVAAERAYLAAAAPGGQVAGLGAGEGGAGENGAGGAGARPSAGAVRIAESRGAKVRRMWDALLDPADASCVSLRAAYVETTGDDRVTGLLRHCDRSRLAEALDTGAIGEVLGDSIARRMIADYRETGVHDGWMRWCSTAPAMDFRTQRRVRWGGYANLSDVSEGANYAAMTTPSDEEETYSVSKRGGTESVTLEAIRNDDAMALQRLPLKLSRAAKRTLSAFAAKFLTANADLADGVALFHNTHKNLGSTALSAAALAAARLAMVKQTELSSDKPLGIGPSSLLVPFDLERTAVDLFRRSTENDRNFVQSLALDVVPVPELTDADDWYLAADPMDVPTVEIGFLDGRREPELFVQDDPTAGSLFAADKITWKVRHVYGGAALDHRGLYKSAVSG